MFNPAYLLKSRNGIFYLRWPVPIELHPAKKPSTLKVSLRTRNPRLALRLSRSLSQIGERINDYGRAVDMKYPEIRALLHKHFSAQLRARKSELDNAGPLPPEKRTSAEAALASTNDAVTNNISLDAWYGGDDSERLQAIMQQHGVELIAGTPEYALLETDHRRAYRDALVELLAYDEKLRRYNFDTDHEIPAAPVAEKAADSKFTIAQLADAYTAEKQRANSWVPKTILEKADHLELLYEILGKATTLDQLNALSARRVKEVLTRYPKNRSKNPATRGKSLDEVINLGGVDLIQVPTINKYLQTYSDMFEWAHQNGLTEKNHFSGLTIRVRKDRKQGRAAFSSEQMASILRVVTDENSPLTRKPYRKWGPLIGAYTGARLNEIAQLQLADFVEKDGIWCFDINDAGDGKQLKTASAKRLVPVHPHLIALGLLEHVEVMKRNKQVRLFPDFSYSPNNGWGRTLGRWFNDTLLPALQIKWADLVFHSLRHTVVTRLSQAGIDQTFVKAIVGHQQTGVTQQVYFKEGYTVRQLSDALSSLHYDY